MNPIEKIIYETVSPAIDKLTAAERADIYVYTLSLAYEYGDYRKPYIVLGYNTNAQVQTSLAKAASLKDARWNYAFWLHNKVAVAGNNAKQATAIAAWIKSAGLLYTEQDEIRNYDACLEKAEKIAFRFVDALIGVIKQLHADGVTLPIIIHALEYFEESKEWNIAANGQELVTEFVEWLESDEF